jgi:hypothetical protein
MHSANEGALPAMNAGAARDRDKCVGRGKK